MRRDGLIVDIRGNRGGHTSQLVIEKLAREIVGGDVARHPPGRRTTRPTRRRGPMVALADE